ncbi:glucose dehydrogenase [Microbispora triticiradicis]|uniref:Glucose dehydrogenase n=3 Tax=Microbispora TaxID=2005 RepID=A0ABY3LNI7_9ACTN|nr:MULTISPECIES: PQQ-dependent sugar dehydrogenase [Microbispora]RGA02999.1 glucose dehydrogenase [Microbispora triticiradicis]TLP54505.1 glucose dehydrogenase [Microbispora fusca]TYB42590.1 glucose dehydrogenase [Microbispora tritici]
MFALTTRGRPWPRALAAFVAALASVAAMIVASSTPASAATSTVVGVASGRCLTVAGNSTTPGARVTIYDCNGQASQTWTSTTAGELRVYSSPRCLDVVGQDTTPPATLQISTCTGAASQKWRINSDGSIVGVQSGMCLDVSGARTANNTPVQLWTCNGQSNQKWTTSTGSADTQPPTVPGNPRVSGLVCDSVTFAWSASTDNVGVAFYDVYHDGQLMKSVSGTTLSTTLTVVPGSTWGLYVNARDAAGNVSQASATVTITPPQCQSDTQAPTAPSQLTGSASGTTVTLQWTAATDNVGVRAYLVYRGGTLVGTVTGNPPATTFIDSGLSANTSYQYYVVARDAQSNVSSRSNTATVTTGGGCADSVCGVTQIATETDLPWGLLTLPDGTILYSRRDVHDIIHLDPATGAKTNIGTVPNVDDTDGEGGLMGLAIAPTFASDHWLYMMHTTSTDNRIVRIKLENDQLTLSSEQILLTGILRNKYHNGGRLRFGPDGKLYASTGDAQNGDNAQNLNGLNGKVLRLNPDGTVPSDNPFGTYVWSYGHRNPQGLAFDSQGRLWEQEFGNSIMDETNLITKGGNYGWPACEGTTGTCGTAGYIAPKRTYPVAEGSCSGIAIVNDVIYIACERGTRLYRVPISGSSLPSAQVFFNGTYGRLRTVEPAPDGGLWLTTSTQGDKDGIPNNGNEKIFHVTLGS